MGKDKKTAMSLLFAVALVLFSGGVATAELPLGWLITQKYSALGGPGDIVLMDPFTAEERVVATPTLVSPTWRVIAGPGDQLYAGSGQALGGPLLTAVVHVDPVTGTEAIVARYEYAVLGLARGPGSILYVGQDSNTPAGPRAGLDGGVWQLDLATGLTSQINPRGVEGLRVDHRARIVTVDRGGGVTVIDPATSFFAWEALPGRVFGAHDLALGRDGAIYVAALDEYALVRYDPVTATPTVLIRLPASLAWSDHGGGTPGLSGIEFGPDGFIYGTGRLTPDVRGVFRIDPRTGAWATVTPRDTTDSYYRVDVIRKTCDCVPDSPTVIDLPPGDRDGVPITIELRDAFGKPLGPEGLGGTLPIMRVDGPEPSRRGAKPGDVPINVHAKSYRADLPFKPRFVPMKFDGKRYRADLPASFFKQPGMYVAAPIAGDYGYDIAPTCLTRIIQKQKQ